jgi:hypothetical protein
VLFLTEGKHKRKTDNDRKQEDKYRSWIQTRGGGGGAKSPQFTDTETKWIIGIKQPAITKKQKTKTHKKKKKKNKKPIKHS